jgi:suppressor of fused
VLIGGDAGLVVKLAPADDATWRDRSDVAAGPRALDAVFAACPEGVIASGPAAYLDAIAAAAAADGDEADDAAADGDEAEAEADEAATAAADGDEDAAAAAEAPDPEAFALLGDARRADPDAALDRTPAAGWGELAWQWLDDGVAHRALLARLGVAHGAQLAAIDDLRTASAAERAVALPRLALALAPALEAVLVGCLVRDDQLTGVVVEPRDGAGGDAAAGDDAAAAGDDDGSPGWLAIDRALAQLYPGVEPLHYGTLVPYRLGGPDPIHGISVFARTEPKPHWHVVTYGFTDLFGKETDDPEISGFGFELTLRLARAADDARPPTWALNFLQNLGRYVFSTRNRFAAGHKMGLNGPIALDSATAITAICFADDPELGEIVSAHGRARFIQIVGITDDEYRLIQEWSTTGLVEILEPHLPLLWTDLDRRSVLDDPATAAAVRARVDAEGSSEDLTFAGDLQLEAEGGQVRIELGALYAAALPRAMRGRIRHGRDYQLRGRQATLTLEPGDTLGYRFEEDDLVIEVTQELAREIEESLREALAGTYRFASWPRLIIVVTPSIIRAQDGSATEVRGVADPDDAARILAADEAARASVAATRGEDDNDDDDDEDEEDEEDDDDGGEDDEDDGGEDGDAEPDLARVQAALAMTTRGLRLAPKDEDLQFTHAMLLLDADRAGDPARSDELLAALAGCAASVRINIAVRMSKLGHPRFDDVVELALGEALPARIFGGTAIAEGGASIASFGDVAHELFAELGQAILAQAPRLLDRLVLALPGDAALLAELAHRALAAGQHAAAMALYDRLILLPIPDDGDVRVSHLRTLNNACIHAHGGKAYDAAVRIADHAQRVAPENPHLYHAAACAYAAVHDYVRAFDQVKLAIDHGYEHVANLETDHDLGPLLEWPEVKELFRDWHARREGN